MLSAISAFVASVTGKVVLGTSVAVAVVGGAHALDVVELPIAADSDEQVEVIVEADEEAAGAADEAVGDAEEAEEADDEVESANHGQEVSEFAHVTELEGCDRGQAIASLASGQEKDTDHCDRGDGEEPADDAEDVVADAEETGEADEADDEVEFANHGQEVSEFAHVTELEGCERGQAVASLASGQEKDADHCDRGDGEASAEDADEADEAEGGEEPAPADAASEWSPGDGRPSWAGEGQSGNSGNGNGNAGGNGNGNGNGRGPKG